jgi:hypothetical protein
MPSIARYVARSRVRSEKARPAKLGRPAGHDAGGNAPLRRSTTKRIVPIWPRLVDRLPADASNFARPTLAQAIALVVSVRSAATNASNELANFWRDQRTLPSPRQASVEFGSLARAAENAVSASSCSLRRHASNAGRRASASGCQPLTPLGDRGVAAIQHRQVFSLLGRTPKTCQPRA